MIHTQDADFTLLCPCGCGETFPSVGSRGRPRRYFSAACSLRVNHRVGGWDGKQHSAESRAKMSAAASRPRPWLRGEKNGMTGRIGPASPTWKGGGSPERQRLYSSGEWRRLRRQLRVRAGAACERCGSAESLHMHHIKPWAVHPELRLELGNLVLLCALCHRAEHARGGAANG